MNEPTNGNIALIIIFIIVFSHITNLGYAAIFFSLMLVIVYGAIRALGLVFDRFFKRD